MKKRQQRSWMYVGFAFCAAMGWAAIAPLGCTTSVCSGAEGSGREDCSTTAGTGSTGGAAGTGGSGGAGTAGTGGNPSDASGPACGGFASLRCPEPSTTFCDYPDNMACGTGDATGVCTPRPNLCPKDCPGVCGCDGKRYCNGCEANSAGTDVQPTGSCQ
jgi:hypothetical protein